MLDLKQCKPLFGCDGIIKQKQKLPTSSHALERIVVLSHVMLMSILYIQLQLKIEK